MAVDTRRAPFETLAEVASRVAAETDLRVALQILAACAADVTGSDLVVVRMPDLAGDLVARAVAPTGSALAAEVAGSRAAAASIGPDGVSEPTRRAAERTLIVRALAEDGETRGWSRRLELAGEALAAGGDAGRAWLGAIRVATETAGARSGLLWRLAGGELELAAAEGLGEGELEVARALAQQAIESSGPLESAKRPALGGVISTIALGRPPIGVLQLVHAEDSAPVGADVPALTAFAARATQALRAAGRADELSVELERTRALVEVVGEAISRLSLAHTL